VQSLVKVWGYSSPEAALPSAMNNEPMVSRLGLRWGLGSLKGAKGRIVARKDALSIMINESVFAALFSTQITFCSMEFVSNNSEFDLNTHALHK
jgi:hypothetical protein